ncbi:MAG: transposase [Desulforhopalus sp.]|jgi:transposase
MDTENLLRQAVIPTTQFRDNLMPWLIAFFCEISRKQIIPKSIVTAGLLAYILIGKFCDALPFYRQERMFERIGAEISRANMCNWAMKAASACQILLLLLLEQEVRSGPLINIDETTVQVLDEPGRAASTKSYMWVCRGGPPDSPAVLYHYSPSRSSDVARTLLMGYKGGSI